MADRRSPRVLSERQGRWLLNLFPPLLFQRIRVIEIGTDYRSCTVRVARSWLTRNLHGTIFGGTIFAAADPYHAILYWQVFARRGRRVQVWLRRARIEYLKPASTALTLRFELTDDDIETMTRELDRHGRHSRTHEIDAIDTDGSVCARISTEVYVRFADTDPRDITF